MKHILTILLIVGFAGMPLANAECNCDCICEDCAVGPCDPGCECPCSDK